MTNTGTPSNTTQKSQSWPLTEAQISLVAAVHKLRLKNGLAPSYEELMKELGLSKTVVATRVRLLRKRGILAAAPGRYRNLFITRAGRRAIAPHGRR